MIGIDATMLVKYLTNDNEEQSQKVLNLLEQYSGTESSIHINNTVLCEVVWVLEAAYKYPKQYITHALKLILQTPELSFDNHATIVKVLYDYEQSDGADFSDILISISNKDNNCIATYSFHKKSCKQGYFTSLENKI